MIDETKPVLTGSPFETLHKHGSLICILQRQIIESITYGLVENWKFVKDSGYLTLDPSLFWDISTGSELRIGILFTEKPGVGSIEITLYEQIGDGKRLVSHQQYFIYLTSLDSLSDTYIDYIHRRNPHELSTLEHEEIARVFQALLEQTWSVVL